MNTKRQPPRALIAGTRYDTMKELRLLCKQTAVFYNFTFKVDAADKSRYRIHCNTSDTCPWRLHASSITSDGTEETNIVEIKVFIGEHTCNGHHGSTFHPQAGASMISSLIQERLKDHPKYRAIEIKKDARRDAFVNVSYSTAWRAKDQAMKNINGSHEQAYAQLPQLCADLVQANPDSTIILDRTVDNQFRRLFICYAACANGFGDCRPVLGLDGAHLTGLYRGIMLSATGVDANGALFPLAYAIVDAENDDNWMWFNTLLRKVIDQHAAGYLAGQTLAFISNRQKGLLESIERAFPNSPHSYCLRHLWDNLYKYFKNKELRAALYEVARSITEEQYNTRINKMRSISSDAVDWLLEHAPREHWVEFYFAGNRYGHITSNIAEALNAWLLDVREKPIIALIESHRHKIMKWFSERRQKDINTEGILVSTAAEQIKETLNFARRYTVLESNDIIHEVFSPETVSTYIVRLDNQTCTCFQWQLSGLPCGHACAVSLQLGHDPQEYAKGFYRLDAYRGTYENAIFSAIVNAATRIPFPALHGDPYGVHLPLLLPPIICRQPGRPKTKRIRGVNEGGGRVKRLFRCSSCTSIGHTSRTCPNPTVKI